MSRPVAAGVQLLAIVAGLVLVATGAASWPLLVAAAVPWLLLAARRWGVALGASATLVVSLLLFLLVLLATGATGLPMLGTVSLLWLLLGVAGVALGLRLPSAARRVGRSTVLTWAPAFSGAAAWIATAALAAVVPGASRLSWVMMGDSANNLLFAREVVARGGVAVGGGENPVPLPTAILGYVIAAGRDGTEPSALLRHDITGFVVTWTLLIALSCLVIGAAAATLSRAAGATPTIVAMVSAGTSLLPLSWYFTGYPLEFGFFNTHLAYTVIFAAVIAYLGAQRHPAIVVAVLAGSGTLLLAVWSPLVLLPLALAAVVIARHWRALIATRGAPLVILTVGVVQIAAYGLVVVLPALLQQGGFLASPGGIIGFRKWIIVLIAVAALGLALLATRSLRSPVVLGTAAIAAASAVGIGALLFVSRSWSYYPLKLAWLCGVVLVVFAVALAAAVVARSVTRRGIRAALLAVVAIATIAFLFWVPRSGLPYDSMNPVQRVLSGAFLGPGDELAEQIFALENPQQPTLLWNSGDPNEGTINFWLLQLRSGSVSSSNGLRYAAYGLYDDTDVADLCEIVGWMGGETRVITAEDDLGAAVATACPDTAMTVEQTDAR